MLMFCCCWLIFLQQFRWKRRLRRVGLQYLIKKEVSSDKIRLSGYGSNFFPTFYNSVLLSLFLDRPPSSESKLLLHSQIKSWNDHPITFCCTQISLNINSQYITISQGDIMCSSLASFEFTKASSTHFISLPVKIQCCFEIYTHAGI